MSYIDGYVIPVRTDRREEYKKMEAFSSPIFIEHGALRVAEYWGDDVPHGQQTDFYRAVDAKEGESIVFGWMEWPSKEARDAGNAAAMADPRFKDFSFGDILDGKRMIFGGFTSFLDVKG